MAPVRVGESARCNRGQRYRDSDLLPPTAMLMLDALMSTNEPPWVPWFPGEQEKWFVAVREEGADCPH